MSPGIGGKFIKAFFRKNTGKLLDKDFNEMISAFKPLKSPI